MCGAVVAPTVAVQLASGLLIRDVGGEPKSYVLLRTLILTAVGLGAVLLSRLQRARSGRDETLAPIERTLWSRTLEVLEHLI